VPKKRTRVLLAIECERSDSSINLHGEAVQIPTIGAACRRQHSRRQGKLERPAIGARINLLSVALVQ
jgi:hypothetical protein